MRKCFLILSVLTVLASGQELVLNGDFEDGLDFWATEANNNQGNYVIDYSPDYGPEPGNEVRVYKYMRYYAQINQVTLVPGVDVRFSASAKLLASKGSTSGYYSYAALILEYLDAQGSSLGRTLIIKKLGSYDPQNGPYLHVIPVTSNDWENYEFVLAEELENLSGISPTQVVGVKLIIESRGTGVSG